MMNLKGNAFAAIFLTLLLSGEVYALEFGWNELPNTNMRSVCPPNTQEYSFTTSCSNVINAWSGGLYDSKRNRYIIWGGGHGDYYGNEVYSLSLNNFTFSRLTDPSSGFVVSGTCVDSLPDGNPVSRHTYGGLAYIAHVDKMFAYGGSRACGSGGFGTDTWTFDFTTNTWEKMQATGKTPKNAVVAAAYDAQTKKVFVHTGWGFFAYDYDTDTWEELWLWTNNAISGFDKSSGVLDPVRRKFVVVGSGGVHVIDLNQGSDYSPTKLTTTGPQTIMNDGRSPGLAYDSVRDKIVAWDGSDYGSTPDTVYVLDLDTKAWIAVADTGNGPAGGNTRGTFGRWQFIPSLDAFVVTNSVDENAFLFRFEAGSLPDPDLIAPDKSTQLIAN